MKRQIFRPVLGLIILAVLLGHAAHSYRIAFVSRLDAIIYDVKVRLTMPRTIDERVVILDIDERSLAEVGRWPWGRDRLANLISNAFERYGVVLLGMDLILAEADDSSGLPVLDRLAGGPLKNNEAFQTALGTLRPELDYDRRFAEILAKHAVILSFNFANGGSRTGTLPPPVLPPGAFQLAPGTLTAWESYGGNRPEFQNAAMGAGHNNGWPDLDGVSRRVPLVVEHAGNYYEALALAMARAAIGNPKPQPVFRQTDWLSHAGHAAIEAIDLPAARGTLRIPVDAHGAALIPYRGVQGSYRYYSASDVLAQRLPGDALRGRIALLGTTAPGLLDLRVTPVAETYPGVEVHANLVSGILDGTVKSRPWYATGIEVTLLLLIGLVMVFWLPSLSPMQTTLAAAALLLLVIAMDLWLWQTAYLALPMASVMVLAIVLYGLDMAVGYFLESSAKRRLATLFGQYVPPELVQEMSRNPERYDMEGRSAELTVLFADIRSFTALSEGLSPQELARLMNEYFSAMTAVIRENRGTLDKYVGDAIMAFWGAPVDDALHARHAVAAGMQMQRRLTQINVQFAARGWPKLAVGVGINTGVMTVGDMGSRERKAYTVLGDAVNLGSRFEGLTAHYGVGIIIGEATQRLLRDVACRELDRVRVKGRAGSVAIFEPVGAVGEIGEPLRLELALWQQALAQYRAQDWDAAQAALERLGDLSGGRKLYALYLTRVAALRAKSPAHPWDGVWQFETK